MVNAVRTRIWRSGSAAVLAGVLLVSPVSAGPADHFPFGPLSAPRAIPAWKVMQTDGSSTDLPKLLRGHITALQLMFTSCNATCPLQGATFASAQQQLGTRLSGAQFISLSIDPANDSPAAMAEWLKTFDARAGWRAVTPKAADVADVFRILGDGGLPRPAGADPHSGQVYIINGDGVLVYRTAAMPSARAIVDAMVTAATTGWN